MIELIGSWIVFPAVLIVVCLGCGLLFDSGCARAGSKPLPTALLPAVGLAAVIVLAQFLTLLDATAELATPLVVALAALGLLLGLRHRPLRRAGWGIAAVACVFAIYAAPVVLSGEATIAGFIKLDDTATWLALTDRVLEHGRDLDGLAPSTYEATLDVNLAQGYPVGVFLPFGIASALSGIDVAWTIQPYMATLAAILALGLWTLARPLATRRALRAGATVIGAVPALLFGYYLWGGVKELAAAALIAALAALVAGLREQHRPSATLLAPALVAAALLGVLSGGGGVWLVPLLLPAVVWLWRDLGGAAALRRAAAFVCGVALLTLPVILPGGLLPPTSSPLTDAEARGNLVGPLEPAQAAGIWPAGDFRFDPDAELLAFALIAIACAGAALGLYWSVRRGQVGAALYVLGVLVGAGALAIVGSPWVEAKGLATASAAIPFAAMLGAGGLALGGHRFAALILGAIVAGGVLWSAALAYRDVRLAPRAQLEDLEEIGEIVAGQGPVLMTDYSPYGARHFLRDGDPESVSELRRHPIPLLDGSTVPKGEAADTDAIDPAALAEYPWLVTRRGPHSRPPGEFDLAWAGAEYELWTRSAEAEPALGRLPLGKGESPTGVARCEEVLDLGELAGNGGHLLAAERDAPVSVALDGGESPSGTITARVDVERAGGYEVWLEGSIVPSVEARVDGEPVAERRHQLNNLGGYVSFGEVSLARGAHEVELEFSGPGLVPGSGGDAGPVGPLVLEPQGAAETRLVRVAAGDAASLCGRPWDWIEARR